MGPLSTLFAFPVAGPIGAVGWIARQVANAAMQEMLDPARIETALLALERRLDAGTIDEAAFEAEEARLLEELADIRAARAGGAATFAAEDTAPDEASPDEASPDGASPPAPVAPSGVRTNHE